MSDEGLEGIVFQSGGQQLIGTLFSAWGPGPKPTALLLHGLPGIEKNHDMALFLRDHGWNSLIFHYRGCHGSAGAYNLGTVPADVRAALDVLCSGAYPQVDPGRLVLIGHSLGGWAALLAVLDEPRVRAVAALAAASNPGAMVLEDLDAAAEITRFLQGITPAALIAQWRGLGAPRTTPLAHVARIAPRPLLIVHGALDAVVPLAQSEALYAAAGDPRALIVHPEANHSFTRHRAWLFQTLLDWLSGLFQEPL
jgi:dipeptidyl aminopeptidase/acylaminoacyl peptidase